MIYTDLTKKAMRIAYDAHKDQVDKSGLPYIFHPFHLAEQMTDEVSVCAAFLHDVVEDTSITFEDLEAHGIPAEVIEALRLLTHDSSVAYMDYVWKIKDSGNKTAITVKLADLRHNSDESRLNSSFEETSGAEIHPIDEKAAERTNKYKTAIDILEGCGKGVYIEKEVGTGWIFTVLRVDGVAICSSKNDAPMPRAYSDPIQTDDLANKKTFSTYRNPEYEDITIVPGLKLEYTVCESSNKNPVARMTRTFKEAFEFSVEYTICDNDEIITSGSRPFPRVSISNDGAIEAAILEGLPENDICVSIYPDETFSYDPRSLVEKRYAVSIAEQHMQWLPHIFHAYYLGLNI